MTIKDVYKVVLRAETEFGHGRRGGPIRRMAERVFYVVEARNTASAIATATHAAPAERFEVRDKWGGSNAEMIEYRVVTAWTLYSVGPVECVPVGAELVFCIRAQ